MIYKLFISFHTKQQIVIQLKAKSMRSLTKSGKVKYINGFFDDFIEILFLKLFFL